MAKRIDYSEYVEHPRYGRSPRFTGLDPDPNARGVRLHPRTNIHSAAVLSHLRKQFGQWPPSWQQEEGCKIVPGTAVAADVSLQVSRPVPISHYYDLDCTCRDCGRHFLFFAVEQKYWYEELQFVPEADCVRCFPCRSRRRAIADQRQR